MITGLMTANEFGDTRHTLPDGGRWHELHTGHPVLLEAPDDLHGTVVLNLSRAFADWFREQPSDSRGYASHEVGLHVATCPDTVLVPAVSYFDVGKRFSQSDLVIADVVPRLVVDVASSNDRRRQMRERSLLYLKHGVEMVWIPDPFKREVQVMQRGSHTLALGLRQKLTGHTVLPNFSITVTDVFVQPDWWTKPK